jgi:hypothetical protein
MMKQEQTQVDVTPIIYIAMMIVVFWLGVSL